MGIHPGARKIDATMNARQTSDFLVPDSDCVPQWAYYNPPLSGMPPREGGTHS
jgi:hypothetical protein